MASQAVIIEARARAHHSVRARGHGGRRESVKGHPLDTPCDYDVGLFFECRPNVGRILAITVPRLQLFKFSFAVAVTGHGLAPPHALLQPQLRKVGFSLGGGIPQIRYYSLNLFDGRMSLRFKAYAGLRHRRSRRDFYI